MGRASIKFFGIRGTQANTEYYVCMVPLSVLSKLFIFSDSELPPSIRSQRILNKARIPEMKRYILQNRDSYVFSALTASVDGDIVFKPIDGIEQHRALGEIEISINNRIVINDGQHRKAAIDAALAECPELRYEDIAVVLFPDTGLKRSQQMFSDLNRYAIRPTKSINILYDQRDPFSAMICNIVEDLPMFGKWVDKEKASVSNRSRALFTLSGIYGSSQDLVKGLTLENEQDRRDEGLCAIPANSPTAFEDWYHYRMGIGHPWEVVRGGNSTHVDLYVQQDEYGYHFHVAGDHRRGEAIRFYLAVRRAGLPVSIRYGCLLADILRGADTIGIVPEGVIPRYCEWRFPGEQTIDFMRPMDDELEKMQDAIAWQPIPEVRLI